MTELLPLRYRGRPRNVSERILGRVSDSPAPEAERGDTILVVSKEQPELAPSDLVGHAAVLLRQDNFPEVSGTPVVAGIRGLDAITNGTVAAVNDDGQIFLLFRPESGNNALFTTNSCNSNCLMCSQPPHDDDIEGMAREQLRLIDLVDEPPQLMGITGGEPTLLGNHLITILDRLKRRMPETHVHMLTNGRRYSERQLVQQISEVDNPLFLSTIPLYADNAADHDYVVQAHGAFDETITGFYNAAEFGLRTEVRVVLHKQTIPRLADLAEFIYRNLPFVEHVALMGLENMGYVKKNWDLLWLDPLDYRANLVEAVRHLFMRRIPVSIYNLQLCVLPSSVWPFARQSISDYKNIYLDECAECSVRSDCGGLFKSAEKAHSRGIRAIKRSALVA